MGSDKLLLYSWCGWYPPFLVAVKRNKCMEKIGTNTTQQQPQRLTRISLLLFSSMIFFSAIKGPFMVVRLVVSNMLLCSPGSLGKWSNLASIFFQMGWFNHHLVVRLAFLCFGGRMWISARLFPTDSVGHKSFSKPPFFETTWAPIDIKGNRYHSITVWPSQFHPIKTFFGRQKLAWIVVKVL